MSKKNLLKRKLNLSPETELKKNSWSCCENCGDQIFPKTDKSDWLCIIASEGKCPYCKLVKTLIPYSDWKNCED